MCGGDFCSGKKLNMFWRSTVKLLFDLAFLIQKVKDAQLSLDEINAGLVVIEVYQRPWDFLLHVFLLLQFENMLQGRDDR